MLVGPRCAVGTGGGSTAGPWPALRAAVKRAKATGVCERTGAPRRTRAEAGPTTAATASTPATGGQATRAVRRPAKARGPWPGPRPHRQGRQGRQALRANPPQQPPRRRPPAAGGLQHSPMVSDARALTMATSGPSTPTTDREHHCSHHHQHRCPRQRRDPRVTTTIPPARAPPRPPAPAGRPPPAPQPDRPVGAGGPLTVATAKMSSHHRSPTASAPAGEKTITMTTTRRPGSKASMATPGPARPSPARQERGGGRW